MIARKTRINSDKAERKKAPLYTFQVEDSLPVAAELAKAYKGRGLAAKVFPRTLKADNIVAEVYVIVVRDPRTGLTSEKVMEGAALVRQLSPRQETAAPA